MALDLGLDLASKDPSTFQASIPNILSYFETPKSLPRGSCLNVGSESEDNPGYPDGHDNPAFAEEPRLQNSSGPHWDPIHGYSVLFGAGLE